MLIHAAPTIDALGRSFRVLIKPADDVPGQWVGHCLDLDIVSLGMSASHALEMVTEAVLECIADDLDHGLNPLDRRPAPPESYAELERLLFARPELPDSALT